MSLSGYEIVVESDSTSGTEVSISAMAPNGKVVIGGGVTCADGRGRVVESGPIYDSGFAIGWHIFVVNSDPTSPPYEDFQANVWAICVDA